MIIPEANIPATDRGATYEGEDVAAEELGRDSVRLRWREDSLHGPFGLQIAHGYSLGSEFFLA